MNDYYFLLSDLPTPIIAINDIVIEDATPQELTDRDERFTIGIVGSDSVLFMATDNVPTLTICRNAPPRPIITGILKP